MRYWKRRGAEIYDWGGGGTYKEKYGCQVHQVPWFTKSRYEFISKLRDEAKEMFAVKQRVMGWLRTKPVRAPSNPDRVTKEKTITGRQRATEEVGEKE
jgi:hypothetical protein